MAYDIEIWDGLQPSCSVSKPVKVTLRLVVRVGCMMEEAVILLHKPSPCRMVAIGTLFLAFFAEIVVSAEIVQCQRINNVLKRG